MIFTITLNPAIDKILYLDGELVAEKNNLVNKKEIDLGGKATHVSAILEQLNTSNKALGFSGSLNKNELESIFDRYNIDHHFININNQDTRESIIINSKHKENYMITEKGLKITESDKKRFFHFIYDNITANDVVVIGGSIPQGFTLDDFKMLIKTLKEKKAFIACDVSKEYLRVAIEEKVDFVKPNSHEIEYLLSGEESIIEKLNHICKNVPNVVCSLGSEGAIYKFEDKFYKIIPPKVDVKNDTGAGDAFVAGYIYGVSNNLSIPDRVKWGVLCSVSKVQHYSVCKIDIQELSLIENNLKIQEVI